MNCVFCDLEKKTEWYYGPDKNDIVVCKDLNSKQFKYRLLCVGISEKWHKKKEKYTQQEKDLLIQTVSSVAEQHIKAGKAKSYTLDLEKLSYKGHYHIQAEMK